MKLMSHRSFIKLARIPRGQLGNLCGIVWCFSTFLINIFQHNSVCISFKKIDSSFLIGIAIKRNVEIIFVCKTTHL